MEEKMQNLIFALIVGSAWTTNTKKVMLDNIWDYGPGVRLFTRLFKSELSQIADAMALNSGYIKGTRRGWVPRG